MFTITIIHPLGNGTRSFFYDDSYDPKLVLPRFRGSKIKEIVGGYMFNTPEERTDFMRAVRDMNDNGTIYAIVPSQWGYRDTQHCREELYQYDRELCYAFFPIMKERDNEAQQAGISTNDSVSCGGGSSAG